MRNENNHLAVVPYSYPIEESNGAIEPKPLRIFLFLCEMRVGGEIERRKLLVVIIVAALRSGNAFAQAQSGAGGLVPDGF